MVDVVLIEEAPYFGWPATTSQSVSLFTDKLATASVICCSESTPLPSSMYSYLPTKGNSVLPFPPIYSL